MRNRSGGEYGMVRSTGARRTGTLGAGDTTSAITTGAMEAASTGTVTRSVPTGFRSQEERAGIRLQWPPAQHPWGVVQAMAPEQTMRAKKTAIKTQHANFDGEPMWTITAHGRGKGKY